MRTFLVFLAVSATIGLICSSKARGDDGDGVLIDTSEGIVVSPDESRGWEDSPGIEGEDVVLFVPRLVLGVPRLVTIVAFWPIRQTLRAVDRYHGVEHVEEVIYWNDAHTTGLLPMAAYQSDFGLTYGANLFHDDLLGTDEQLTLAARYGGRFVQGYELSFEGDRVAGSRLWMESRLRYERNPNLLFSGIGLLDGAPDSPLTWYAQDRGLGLLRLGYTMGRRGRLIQTGATAVFNSRTYDQLPDDVTDKVSIGDVYDTATIAGFQDGATSLELDGNLIVDFRKSHGLNAAGTRLELFGGGTPPVTDFQFVHYGGELAHTIDLFRGNRLLGLRTALEGVHGDTVPFSELPRLGGPHRLRGYKEDRFRDNIAALASVEYRYPVHANISGELFYDVGTVAADYVALADGSTNWKQGFGGGLVVGTADSVAFRVELGYGDDLHVFFASDLAHAFKGRSKQL